MLRRLLSIFARELGCFRAASALSTADDALSARDTAELAACKRARVTVPADCSSCPPATATPAAQVQRLSLAYTEAWLLDHYPDAWYYELGDGLHTFATGILELRCRVIDGRVTP